MKSRLLKTFTVIGLFAFALAHAAAPMVKKQAPGYYRMMLGDFEITVLSDGTMPLEVAPLLTRTTPARVKQALALEWLPANYSVPR